MIGSMGVGKSSVINALLGVKSLVPTNPTKASTTTVMEILYGDETVAVISFLSREVWKDELSKTLWVTLITKLDGSVLNAM